MDEIKEKHKKLVEERDKQKQKVDKMQDLLELQKEKLSKEVTKLNALNEKIDRLDFFIFKDKLKSVGVDDASGIDEVLEVYLKHKQED